MRHISTIYLPLFTRGQGFEDNKNQTKELRKLFSERGLSWTNMDFFDNVEFVTGISVAMFELNAGDNKRSYNKQDLVDIICATAQDYKLENLIAVDFKDQVYLLDATTQECTQTNELISESDNIRGYDKSLGYFLKWREKVFMCFKTV